MGRAFLAVVASEEAASTIGINVARTKLGVFVIGAAFAGFAGSLFASIMSVANPEAFSLNLSILIVIMVILGGMGNLYGPIFIRPPHLAHRYPSENIRRGASHLRSHSDPPHLLPDGIGTRLGIRLIYLISYWSKKKGEMKGKLMSLLRVEEITKYMTACGPGSFLLERGQRIVKVSLDLMEPGRAHSFI
jgi:hypothetical protein